MATDTIVVICPNCKATLRAPATHIGKSGTCRKCGTSVLVEQLGAQSQTAAASEIAVVTDPGQDDSRKAKPRRPTAKQIEFAQTLGVEFSKDVTREALSVLIADKLKRDQEDDESRVEQLLNRESEAYGRLRAEIVAEVDSENPRLSASTPTQIVAVLKERNIAAILISFSMEGKSWDFSDLTGVEVTTSFSDGMNQDEAAGILFIMAKSLVRRPE